MSSIPLKPGTEFQMWLLGKHLLNSKSCWNPFKSSARDRCSVFSLLLIIWQTESAATVRRLRRPFLVFRRLRGARVALPLSPGDPVRRRCRGDVQLQRQTVVWASAASKQDCRKRQKVIQNWRNIAGFETCKYRSSLPSNIWRSSRRHAHLSGTDTQVWSRDKSLFAVCEEVNSIMLFCVFSLSCFSPRGHLYRKWGERTLEDHDFHAMFSSLRSHPLKAFLACFFPTFLHLAVGRRPDRSAMDGDFQRVCGHQS